ncbi:hypothetical protein NDA13_001081 [Ustilago tritici]|nr:hypothetical protein NDA13_001081 [Ustilago tritici]
MRTQATGTLRAVARGVEFMKPAFNLIRSTATSSRSLPTSTLPLVSGRAFSSSASIFAAASSSSAPSKDIPVKSPIRDEAILENSEYVRLVDPKSGALAGPFNTKQILSKLDRSKFWIQQVAPSQPGRATVEYDPSAPPSSVDVSALAQFPICKLIDKKEEFDKQRAFKRKSSPSSSSSASTPSAGTSSGSTSKEVQLTWSVSSNDLAHKLSKAKKEMIKGARINLVVTTKAGGRKYIKRLNPKEDQKREELLKQIETLLCSPEESGEDGGEKQQPIARRLQDVDWQRGGSAAVMSFECFRK